MLGGEVQIYNFFINKSYRPVLNNWVDKRVTAVVVVVIIFDMGGNIVLV